MRSVSSSSWAWLRLRRSISSSKPSSTICLRICSSKGDSPSEALSNDRKLDWCSICLLELVSTSRPPRRNPPDEGSDWGSGLLLWSSSPRRRDWRPWALTRSLSRRSWEDRVPSVPDCLLVLVPASLKLISRTSSSNLLSSSSELESLDSSLLAGKTEPPGLYFFAISSFSSSDFCLLGFAWRNISRRVVTVAFGLVSRTVARHDGQVNRGDLLDLGCETCQENHSCRQDPQKVCRQSRTVRGWYRRSVHI